MIIRRTAVLAGISVSTIWAWQGGLAAVGLSEKDLPRIAESYFSSNVASGELPGLYSMPNAMRMQWKAKGGAERATEIRELAEIGKKFVSTPEFEKMYNEWIKRSYSAVDHGIKPDAPAPAPKTPDVNQMMRQAAAAMVQGYAAIPAPTLKTLFDQDLQNWKGESDKAKLYAKAQQIAPMFQTNQEQWKKEYLLLKSAELGGPSTQAELDAAAAASTQAQADQKAQMEQKAYDEHKFKVELKKRLTGFVTLARSVDYAAQTKPCGPKMCFATPENERKSFAWKSLYRLGKDPTLAAAAFAEQWAKEL